MRTIVKLSVLLSLLTGCAERPAAPVPTAHGVSAPLRYPILLAGARQLAVKDNEESLTTTSVATGLNFLEFTLLDSDGHKYTIVKVTPFGWKSPLLDMGSSPFRVYLELKSRGVLSLVEANSMVRAAARAGGEVQDAHDVSRAIDGATSFLRLIEVCRKERN
jgi:hypothetical protein